MTKESYEQMIAGLKEAEKQFLRTVIPDCTAKYYAVRQAIRLLEERDAIAVNNGKCPSCNWDFENGELDFSNINESRFYCPRCGQAVKWK